MLVNVEVDLRDRCGPARDQGQRPTCLAFAASDAHAAIRGPWDPLSPEYAFYQAQKRAGRPPTVGSYLHCMLACLREDGQPREHRWPYLGALPTDLADYTPPADVGALFGRNSVQPAHYVDRILEALEAGSPAIVLTKLTLGFYTPDPDGVIVHRDTDELLKVPRHAVVAVGYGDAQQERMILVRNSWGPTWGLQGHGWLTADYLARHMYGIAILTDESDVSYRSAAT